MKIARLRTLTLFSMRESIIQLENFMDATKILEKKGIDVRTKRVVVEKNQYSNNEIITFSKDLETLGYWGFCTSFDDPQDNDQVDSAKNIIRNTKNGFVNFRITDSDGDLDTNSISPSVDLIRAISRENEGIDNFRLGFSFGLDEETPFFPYSCVNGREGFSVGLEYVDLIAEVIDKHSRNPLSLVRLEMKKRICWFLQKVTKCCNEIEKKTGIEFLGIDISLAPYPYPLEDQSVVRLLERLGNIARSRGDMEFRFGMNGTMFMHTFISRILKEIVDSEEFKTTGFNGIMYSVLEDSLLSSRYSNGEVNMADLLLLSTTCGCGIDMLPLTNRSSRKVISSMFFDIFAISSALKKPLGVRVLPIPNSRPGDLTRFKHLFFSNAVLPDVTTGISYNELPSQSNEDSEISL